ncbi:nitroreductase family protein [Flexibacterium corallicola]|uniref:nitroreductase family protein n=1 Tax=Flexibacterium corallicola TaxID=3037259 RepID=UPI00286F996B|nr:nitroreductase family protein [Pseudovibrio sp. M1P-2-3]
MTNMRRAEYPVEPIFVDRWSTRSYDGQSMPESDLFSILEAARWAPSAYNIQPWRFIYAHREDESWNTFLDLLDPFNKEWAKNASALIFVISDSIMPGDGDRADHPSRCHSFDSGAAWAQLALQATAQGYHAHAMAGIYFDKIKQELSVPDRFRVEIAVAVGKRSEALALSDSEVEQETPSLRKPIREIAFSGAFTG